MSVRILEALLLVVLAMVASGCAAVQPSPTPNVPAGTPGWVTKMISDYVSKPVENPPAKIVRYEFKGQTVYYIPPPCCDQYSRLFDAQGQLLCAPDGGLTGRGDGKCPDFGAQRKNDQLVWQDPRQR